MLLFRNKLISNTVYLLTPILFLLFFTFLPYASAAEGGHQKILILQDTPGYIIEADQLIEQAMFQKNEAFFYISEDELFYQIPFGNGHVLIKKEVAEKVSSTLTDTPIMQKGGKTVITTVRTAVRDNNISIGSINAGLRMPVLSETATHYKIDFGGRPGYIVKSHTKADLGVPVLMYHHLIENRDASVFKNNNMVIDLKQFEEQMDYLYKNGWKTISLSDLENWLDLHRNLPDKVVAITFDDGLLSLTKYAYPILQEKGYKATSFLIGSRIRQQAQPWADDGLQYVGLKEIRQGADVFDFQHHTHGMHLREAKTGLPYLTNSTYEEIREDIEMGKFQISKAFDYDQSHIRYLAYPFGQFNAISKQAIQHGGIQMAFTTVTGNVKLGDPKYELKRQGIAPNHSLKDFVKKLEGTY